MVPQVLSRSQRRIERQQALLLLVLVLAVSLVSFALGVMVGRGKGEPLAPAAAPVARIPVTPPAGGEDASGRPDLTFYESLPKGGMPPLGSGINLPAHEPAPRDPASAQPQAATPAPPKSQEPVPSAVARPLPASPAAATAKAAPAAEAASPRPQAKPAGGAWTVQAGSFRAAEDARRLQERLAGKGFAVVIQEAVLGEKGTWYRVIVGPFASESAASGAASRLREEEKLSVMIRKS